MRCHMRLQQVNIWLKDIHGKERAHLSMTSILTLAQSTLGSILHNLCAQSHEHVTSSTSEAHALLE